MGSPSRIKSLKPDLAIAAEIRTANSRISQMNHHAPGDAYHPVVIAYRSKKCVFCGATATHYMRVVTRAGKKWVPLCREHKKAKIR